MYIHQTYTHRKQNTQQNQTNERQSSPANQYEYNSNNYQEDKQYSDADLEMEKQQLPSLRNGYIMISYSNTAIYQTQQNLRLSDRFILHHQKRLEDISQTTFQ